jgi:flagellar hook-length control protein FliK
MHGFSTLVGEQSSGSDATTPSPTETTGPPSTTATGPKTIQTTTTSPVAAAHSARLTSTGAPAKGSRPNAGSAATTSEAQASAATPFDLTVQAATPAGPGAQSIASALGDSATGPAKPKDAAQTGGDPEAGAPAAAQPQLAVQLTMPLPAITAPADQPAPPTTSAPPAPSAGPAPPVPTALPAAADGATTQSGVVAPTVPPIQDQSVAKAAVATAGQQLAAPVAANADADADQNPDSELTSEPAAAPTTLSAAAPSTLTASLGTARPFASTPPAAAPKSAPGSATSVSTSSTPASAAASTAVAAVAGGGGNGETSGGSGNANGDGSGDAQASAGPPAADSSNSTPDGSNAALSGASLASAPTTVAVSGGAAQANVSTVTNLAAQIVQQSGGKASRFDITLNPAGLGQVNVQVQITAKGELTAALTFQKPEAAGELQARAADLSQALKDAGFDIAPGGLSLAFAGDMGMGSSGGGASENSAQDQQGWRNLSAGAFGAASRNAQVADLAALQAPVSRGAALRGLDIRI